MKAIRIDKIEAHEMTHEPMFTGGQVSVQFLLDEKIAKEINMGLVKFSPGARTVYHTHPSEQVLYVTEGRGIVATEKEEITATPGMVVYIPAGEKHRHGATEDSSFAHVAILLRGKAEILGK